MLWGWIEKKRKRGCIEMERENKCGEPVRVRRIRRHEKKVKKLFSCFPWH